MLFRHLDFCLFIECYFYLAKKLENSSAQATMSLVWVHSALGVVIFEFFFNSKVVDVWATLLMQQELAPSRSKRTKTCFCLLQSGKNFWIARATSYCVFFYLQYITTSDTTTTSSSHTHKVFNIAYYVLTVHVHQ